MNATRPALAEAMALASEVAALLPRRHNGAWSVSPASLGIHPAGLLSNGPRCFLLITDDGRTTLVTRTPLHTAESALTITGSAPAALASAALRSLLPRIDIAVHPSPAEQQLHRMHRLSEIRARLCELGADAQQFTRADSTAGLSWQFGDAFVRFTLHGTSATGTVSFAGGLGAVEQFLAPFLPPHPGPGRVQTRPPRGCGGVARRVVAAFPHAVESDQDGLVRFSDADGGPLQGWVTPRDVNGPAGPRTRVMAGVIGVGVDLALAALPAIA
ncbi:hypothetical protein ACWCQZ_40785 [Streptomyces sp. NPDC002285]